MRFERLERQMGAVTPSLSLSHGGRERILLDINLCSGGERGSKR